MWTTLASSPLPSTAWLADGLIMHSHLTPHLILPLLANSPASNNLIMTFIIHRMTLDETRPSITVRFQLLAALQLIQPSQAREETISNFLGDIQPAVRRRAQVLMTESHDIVNSIPISVSRNIPTSTESQLTSQLTQLTVSGSLSWQEFFSNSPSVRSIELLITEGMRLELLKAGGNGDNDGDVAFVKSVVDCAVGFNSRHWLLLFRILLGPNNVDRLLVKNFQKVWDILQEWIDSKAENALERPERREIMDLLECFAAIASTAAEMSQQLPALFAVGEETWLKGLRLIEKVLEEMKVVMTGGPNVRSNLVAVGDIVVVVKVMIAPSPFSLHPFRCSLCSF